MSAINTTYPSSCNGSTSLTVVTPTIPNEVLGHIFHMLDHTSKQSFVCVNKLWKDVSIDTMRLKQKTLVDHFIKFLLENIPLDRFPSVHFQSKLINYLHPSNILAAENFLGIKSSIFKIREILVILLQELDNNLLDDLELLSASFESPVHFKNIFKLAKITRQMNRKMIKELLQLNEIDCAMIEARRGHGSDDSFFQIFLKFYSCGDIEKALLVAHISKHHKSQSSLRNILNFLIYQNLKNEAIDIAKNGEDYEYRADMIYWIVDDLVKMGDIDTAMNVFDSALTPKIRYDVIGAHFETFYNHNFDKLLGIVYELPQQTFKKCDSVFDLQKGQGYYLRKISNKLLNIGEIEKGLKLISEIQDENLDFVLNDYSIAIFKSGDEETGVNLAKSMPTNKRKSKTMLEICSLWLKQDRIDKIFESLNEMHTKDLNTLYRMIMTQFLLAKNYEKCDEITDKFYVEHNLRGVYDDFCQRLILNRNIEREEILLAIKMVTYHSQGDDGSFDHYRRNCGENLIRDLIRFGEYIQAAQVFSILDVQDFDKFSFPYKLLKGFFGNEHNIQGIKIFIEECIKIASETEGMHKNFYTALSSVCQEFLCKSKFLLAKHVLGLMVGLFSKGTKINYTVINNIERHAESFVDKLTIPESLELIRLICTGYKSKYEIKFLATYLIVYCLKKQYDKGKFVKEHNISNLVLNYNVKLCGKY